MSGAAPALAAAAVPWGCWGPDATQALPFPARFSVRVNAMRDAAEVSPASLAAALREPIDAKPLRELAAGARSAVVVVDDITRPTPAHAVLPLVLSELAAIPAEHIRILVALGAHRPMVRAELERKLGVAILDTMDVEQHHPYENLIKLGLSSRGTPVRLNRHYCDAELKITVGGVMPHPYMGFGGGAKLVVPGLAGIETLQANHQPAVTGISGGLANPDVDARRDVEEIALETGLAFSCNVIVNSRQQIAGFFCGHPVSSHRAAVAFARDVYATATPGAPYDIVCLNAWPKDGELLQIGNALNCYRTAIEPLLKPDGAVVITACCQLGRGYHSLHGPGMRLHRAPSAKGYLEGREVVVFSPHLNERDFRVSFAPAYRLFTTWDALTAHLDAKYPGSPSVAVFPAAPLQILS
jgi:lactate racemase